MSKRTELIYNTLAQELKEIEDEITAIKNKQFIGTDSIRLYKNLTAVGESGGFDIDTNDTFIHNFAVVFEADNQVAPFCEVSMHAYIDGVRVNPADVMRINTAPAFFNSFVNDSFGSYAPLAPSAGGRQGWYFAYYAYGASRRIQIRIQVDATDSGEITVIPI